MGNITLRCTSMGKIPNQALLEVFSLLFVLVLSWCGWYSQLSELLTEISSSLMNLCKKFRDLVSPILKESAHKAAIAEL